MLKMSPFAEFGVISVSHGGTRLGPSVADVTGKPIGGSTIARKYTVPSLGNGRVICTVVMLSLLMKTESSTTELEKSGVVAA